MQALETHPNAVPWKIEIVFSCGHELSSVVQRHTQPDSQPNAISLPS